MIQNRNEKASAIIQQIEDELKRLQVWSSSPMAEEKLIEMGAFGAKTMSFYEWLQFVLIPRVADIITTGGEFPTQSNVAAYACRELDGVADSEALLSLLANFDQLFNE